MSYTTIWDLFIFKLNINFLKMSRINWIIILQIRFYNAFRNKILFINLSLREKKKKKTHHIEDMDLGFMDYFFCKAT